jgi:hypothetical protein
MEFTEKDAALILKIARSHDAQARVLKKLADRLDHLASHLHDDPEPTQNLQCNVVFQNVVAPKDRRAYSQQFQAELVGLLKEYSVIEFSATYQGK